MNKLRARISARAGGREVRFLRRGALRVVKVDGSRLGWWSAFERAHGYLFSMSIVFLGFLQVLWDRHGATLHDRIAETKVVLLPARPKRIKGKA